MKRPSPARRFGCLVVFALVCMALGFALARVTEVDSVDDALQLANTRIAEMLQRERGITPPSKHPEPAAPAKPTATVATGAAAPIQVFFAPASRDEENAIDNALVQLINSAQSSVHAAFYELQLPAVAEALVARHRNNVVVSVVSDSNYSDRAAVQRCIEAGISVRFDRRSDFMHNKFCVVDGRYVWTGSTNITENCMYRNDNNALLIDSTPLAKNFMTEFQELAAGQFGPNSPAMTPSPVLEIGSVRVECYFAPEDNVEYQVVDEVLRAKQRILFMAFAFTSRPIAEAMTSRRQEGVEVRGIFERNNAADKPARDDYLREHRAQIRLDGNKYNMHHKVILLDSATVITGSYNFSKNANEDNDENLLIIHDPNLAAAYYKNFERLWATARTG